ncbi:MAG TPA: DedA family protein [Ilumatobacter sp.]|nr:DedA family protein [Ilumatobacter sp.]
MLNSLADWVVDVIEKIGYVGVALLVALENLFPPIPSEIVLPFAGFHASDGHSTLWGMIVAATIGSVVGAWILYGVAAAIGPERTHRFVERFGKWFRLTPDDIAKSERWFDRHASLSVLVCRCIPLVRSLISIPAGLRRMHFGVFTLYTTIGSAVWNFALIFAGYKLRNNWHDVEPVLEKVQYVVIAAIVLALAWLVSRRWRVPANSPAE